MKEITRVQLQVIKSPERVRSTLSDMAATLARETEAVKIVEAKERLMSNKISILAKYEGVSRSFFGLSLSSEDTDSFLLMLMLMLMLVSIGFRKLY